MQTSYSEPLPDAFGFNEFDGYPGLPPAKTLVELEMTRLSAEIRRKPSWWIKCRDESILTKWREEALTQAKLMTEAHVDYVLKELDGYANLRDEETGAEVSCHDRIWQSDKLISASLKERLLAGAKNLENVPEEEKDWHPRSNKQVLDLVHPSLYPLVYGRTLSYPEDSKSRHPTTLAARIKPPKPEFQDHYSDVEDDYYLSKKFQWLPTDFKISEDGKSARSESYINNLHPIEHAELHKAIEDLIAAYTPLFERVLTDSIPDNHAVPERTNDHYEFDDGGYASSPKYNNYSNDDEYYKAYQDWEENRPFVTPGLRESQYEPGSLEKRKIKYTLGGRTIQVIVKLANIHLTPENPEYRGGSWHVEGMKNEAIAASGIYYYDEENITESRLAFRTAVAAPENYEQSDDRGCKLTWGMGRDDPCVNELGSVITCQDRCIAFPNTYQHCVSSFELADKSKPGHRKIVALFLVDPAIHRPSTTIVPPQQPKWRASGISANPVLKAAFDKLAPEIIDHIDSMVEGTMTREEAEAYRLELMDERKAFVQKSDKAFFMAPFDISLSSSEEMDGFSVYDPRTSGTHPWARIILTTPTTRPTAPVVSNLPQPLLPEPVSAGTKRKSTAGTSTSKRTKTSPPDPFADTKNTIQTILASPESFSLPSGDAEYRKLVVSIAQYAKSLEGSVAVAGSTKPAPPPKTPEQVSAEAETIINQINRGISKLMAWKTSCKTGSAKYSFDGVCTDPRVFGKVLGLDGPPNFKTKKYTKEEFEDLVGSVTKDVRYDTLYLTGPVNLRYNSDTGEFKISGSYGK